MTLRGYRARRIVDGTGGPVREYVAVPIDGDRIHDIVPAADVPAGVVVEDLEDVVQAIEVGTRAVAEAMRLKKLIGILTGGKYAELIAVGGDLIRDIRALYDLRHVVKSVRTVPGPYTTTAAGRRSYA